MNFDVGGLAILRAGGRVSHLDAGVAMEAESSNWQTVEDASGAASVDRDGRAALFGGEMTPMDDAP